MPLAELVKMLYMVVTQNVKNAQMPQGLRCQDLMELERKIQKFSSKETVLFYQKLVQDVVRFCLLTLLEFTNQVFMDLDHDVKSASMKFTY